MSFAIGATVGDYQVVEILGSGGMGQVYKVRNLISDRMEAMKVLLPNLDTDQELAERFMREIKVQASLDHPNIAALHTAQRINNQLVMIMEFVDGHTIESIMRQSRIPLRNAVDYAMQTLSALAYAHARGVTHRDIKPANMMLTPRGVIKLMDFGIAKINDHRLTQTGRTVGSLFYMSPEQIRGDSSVDARADIYSLGISLYEMATGRRPFEGDSDYSIMAAHLQQPPRPPVHVDPNLPQALNDIILMSLAKDPTQRFQTADAFRAALGSAVNQLGDAASYAPAGPAIQGFSHTQTPTADLPRPQIPTQRPMAPQPPPSGGYAAPVQMAPVPPPPSTGQMPQYRPVAAAPPYQPTMPQFQPMAAPPPQAHRSHRGVYMLLGSLVTVGIIVAGAIYLPKLWKSSASEKPATQVAVNTPQQPTQVSTPAPQQPQPQPNTPSQPDQPQSSPSNPQVEPPQPAPNDPSTPSKPSKPVSHPIGAPPPQPQPQPQPAPPQPQPQPQPAPPPPDPKPQVDPNPPMPQPRPHQGPTQVSAEINELVRLRDLMRSRIHTVNESMRRLREQNEHNGMGVNGELVASHKRMLFYMEVANDALHTGNIGEARTALNNAERELGRLEHHFNL